ncbi:uncharacterized protein LOC143916588 [Arctopsyche grandis]|uniref:uncharacterized protein LOC143916588 n=1 Tax=Arctopsyche grandis TaxID=121162 RepID=UPI00406D9587
MRNLILVRLTAYSIVGHSLGHSLVVGQKFKMKYLIVFALLAVVPIVWGHGMVMDPVNRASRWRFNNSAPANWDDNQLYCGSYGTQWVLHNGKCGMCGDSYSLAPPRPHEIGGKYGEGVIVKSYRSGATIPVVARIVANHNGYFEFHLCNLDRFGMETEECYSSSQLLFASGSNQQAIGSQLGDHNLSIRLPAGVTCKHCVLRWSYTAGNIWGNCPDGTSKPGCGPQETYKTCSDITITA